jgi:hypothetical protein
MLIPQESILRFMFSRSQQLFTLPTLGIYVFVYFFLITVTSGTLCLENTARSIGDYFNFASSKVEIISNGSCMELIVTVCRIAYCWGSFHPDDVIRCSLRKNHWPACGNDVSRSTPPYWRIYLCSHWRFLYDGWVFANHDISVCNYDRDYREYVVYYHLDLHH